MPDPGERRFDLVVFGATSFVGQILCRHLVARHGTTGPLRWAIAGRDAAKLDATAAATGAEVERVLADAADDDALRAMADSCRLVVSTVGPYARYGSGLVAAVVAAGTDYCDLTGEVQWMHRMIEAHGDAARRSGARVLHACGFDSIPSDLGVWYTQQQARERFGEVCTRIGMRVRAFRGGASGGTIASLMNVLEEAAHDRAVRAVVADPYCLVPAGDRPTVRQPRVTVPARDGLSGQWVAPFVMEAVNSRVVHRTNALLGRPWGDGFRYDEAMLMGPGPLGAAKAAAVSGGLAATMAAAAFGPTRSVLRRVAPGPGEGPSPARQEEGFFELRFYGETADGRRLQTRVTGDRDPGYGSTAKMLGETAVALSETDRTTLAGGFWTPAAALGAQLVDRLRAHAGVECSVVS